MFRKYLGNKFKLLAGYVHNLEGRYPNLLWPLRYLLGFVADILICINFLLGKLYILLFGFLGTSWFDHRFDFLVGPSNYHWMERAFLALARIKDGDIVLDIGCGDGSYDGLFYSTKAKSIDAIDKDSLAIEHAKKYYHKVNIHFIKQDIVKCRLQDNKYGIVLMFAVIEHFSDKEGLKVLRKVKKSLCAGGILYGSTPLIKEFKISNWEHKNEFGSAIDLKKFLGKVFGSVTVTTLNWHEKRDDCYFECRK